MDVSFVFDTDLLIKEPGDIFASAASQSSLHVTNTSARPITPLPARAATSLPAGTSDVQAVIPSATSLAPSAGPMPDVHAVIPSATTDIPTEADAPNSNVIAALHSIPMQAGAGFSEVPMEIDSARTTSKDMDVVKNAEVAKPAVAKAR